MNEDKTGREEPAEVSSPGHYEPPVAEDLDSSEGTAATASGPKTGPQDATTTTVGN